MVRSIPATLPSAMVESATKNGCKLVDISQLEIGENPRMLIAGKVVNSFEKAGDVPMCFLMVDAKHNFCVLSVYHMSKDLQERMRAGASILLRCPHLTLVKLQFKGYQYNYQCLKVTDISSLLVNGASLTEQSAPSEVL